MDKQHIEYRFQWSAAKSNGEILVVRGDDWSSFKGDVDIARIWLNNEEKEASTSVEEMRESVDDPIQPQVSTDVDICKEHNIQMKKNKNDKWYHREYKEGKARFCNGYQWGNWA